MRRRQSGFGLIKKIWNRPRIQLSKNSYINFGRESCARESRRYGKSP